MQRKDWVLLALAAANGEMVSPVQLQKSLFLIGENLPEYVGEDYYRFTPYHYGPFDSSVYDDALTLRDEGLVMVAPSSEGRWHEYAATSAGVAEAQRLRAELPAPAAKYVETLVRWIHGLSFEDLLRAVYSAYPHMRVASVFRG